jgi:glycosyltransferase involved in cell wall biosynthesis
MDQGNKLIRPRHDGLLSVVIPVFNEQSVIEESVKQIREILHNSAINHEIIVVDDGSRDNTLEILIQLQESVPLRIIHLSSNSGHMNAIRAGLEASYGDYVLTIDADLQDPPEVIPDMYAIISGNPAMEKQKRVDKKARGVEILSTTYDVVQAYRSDRTADTLWKRKTASIYYRFVKKLTGIDLTPHAADYRIMKRHVVDALVSLPEKNLVFRLLIPSLGYRIALFPIERRKRFAGDSKYTNRKMISLAIDSIIGFSNRPLRYLAYLGTFASIILFIGSVGTLLLYVFGETLPSPANKNALKLKIRSTKDGQPGSVSPNT